MRKISNQLSERIPLKKDQIAGLRENLLNEPLPAHMKNWYYALGATPLILFVFMVVTGILLTFYYIPSPENAYESVRHITEDVSMGYWIRGLHRWASNLMVIAIFLHMIRVFFTQGYRKPRELNWVFGILILFTTFALCFTGYSLVYNQLSYWAAVVGTNMIKEVPLVGTEILSFLRGGEEVSSNTLTRFFNLHIIFLPAVLLILILVHIIMVRLHGVSGIEEKKEKTYSFYPEHFYHTIIVALFLLALLSALTVILPPGLGEQADPLNTPAHIKPEWYFFAVYSILKFIPLKAGIYLFAALALVTTFWPFLENFLRKRWPELKMHYWVGSITIIVFLFFTVYEIIVQ